MTTYEQQQIISFRLEAYRSRLMSPVSCTIQVERVVKYIIEHLFEASLNVENILNECRITYGCIHGHFKHFTGRTIHSFKVTLRMKAAVELMKDPELELTEIAFGLGYDNYSTFRRAFKGWKGRSPSEYRERIAG